MNGTFFLLSVLAAGVSALLAALACHFAHKRHHRAGWYLAALAAFTTGVLALVLVFQGDVFRSGFPKDRFYIYQAHWRPDFPMAHILPHWDWPDRVGQVTPVHVYTSGDEAELFLNGKSLGRKKKIFEGSANQQIKGQSAYRIRWDDVIYAPGELKVVAYKAGKEWVTETIKTTGPPTQLSLKPDRASIAGNGHDLSFVTLTVADKDGLIVPRSRNPITFEISGPGEIVATDNGDPTDLVAFSSKERKVFNGLALAIVKAKRGQAGIITVTAKSEGLTTASTKIQMKWRGQNPCMEFNDDVPLNQGPTWARGPFCMKNLTLLAVFVSLVLESNRMGAGEIHVAQVGNDSASGSADQPYLTINKAASVAQPGDTVIVHGGTYREWVKPTRGGTSESNRIKYRAAPGEEVLVKGSERISRWTPEEQGVWKVEVPNGFFADYNPYELKLSGGWLNYGQWHHRGDVYLSGEAFYEKKTAQEVTQTEGTWFCQVEGKVTIIRANFGKANPNAVLTEINVRESIFMPQVTGLKYITVDGFHFMHAAANWAPPNLALQMGAVGTRMGKYWIIENCTVVNARCVGIILGHSPGDDYSDIDAFGEHIVRNNIIRRCGQAGIAGQKGATRSLISGNLIEETNYRREFGGWETAAIKFHNSVDTVISGNLIRGVDHEKEGAFGIWMDYGNQGTRITGNIIYNTEAAAVFLEMDHGPTLADNNVLIGQPVRSNSEGTVFAHNLFVDCSYDYSPDTERRSEYYTPHTTKIVGRKTGTAQDDRWYNNIFVRQGLDRVKKAPGYSSNYNVFLEGAKKSTFGDEHSLVEPYVTGLRVKENSRGATITFSVSDAALQSKGPQVNAALVGIFPTVGQTIEDRHGEPLGVNSDLNGKEYASPISGPLADLKNGLNAITWSVRRVE